MCIRDRLWFVGVGRAERHATGGGVVEFRSRVLCDSAGDRVWHLPAEPVAGVWGRAVHRDSERFFGRPRDDQQAWRRKAG
eukprot:11285990-Prorocentrum_lima.AAC.1